MSIDPITNASLNRSNPNNPQPVNFTVSGTTHPTSAPELSTPEPSTVALFVCALLVLAARWARRRTA